MQMPLGKHKGEELGTIPPSYLRWFLANVEDAGDELRAAVKLALEAHPPVESPEKILKAKLEKVRGELSASRKEIWDLRAKLKRVQAKLEKQKIMALDKEAFEFMESLREELRPK